MLYHILVTIPKNREKYDEEYRQKVEKGVDHSGILRRVIDRTIQLPHVLLIVESSPSYNSFYFVNASFDDLQRLVGKRVLINTPYYGRGWIKTAKLTEVSRDNLGNEVAVVQEINFDEARSVSLFEE